MRALRVSRLPRVCLGTMRLFTGDLGARFDAYIGDAAAQVRRMDAVLRGDAPRWHPEPERGQAMPHEAPAL